MGCWPMNLTFFLIQRPNVRSTHHLPEYREAPVLRLGAHAPTGPEKAQKRFDRNDSTGTMTRSVGVLAMGINGIIY